MSSPRKPTFSLRPGEGDKYGPSTHHNAPSVTIFVLRVEMSVFLFSLAPEMESLEVLKAVRKRIVLREADSGSSSCLWKNFGRLLGPWDHLYFVPNELSWACTGALELELERV